MKKIILLFCFICIITPVYSQTNINNYYNSETKQSEFLDKAFIQSLAFSENQIFQQIYSKDTPENRIERLELAVYGAIQNGNIKSRIKKIKKSVTNITDGGYGLQYANKLFDLAGNSSNNGYWSIRNIPKTLSEYHPNYHSNRIYHPNCCSHRIPPHHYHNRNRNADTIINGNNYSNYSMRTGIHILND